VEKLYTDLISALPFQATSGQADLLEKFVRYVWSDNTDRVFMIRGYAGTGKTSILGAIARVLPSFRKKISLMAPTGRAAKVLQAYTGKPSFTIHRSIYVPAMPGQVGSGYKLRENRAKDTIYIIDEASMITDRKSDEGFGSGQGLLSDLIEFVRMGKNCSLVLVGDPAQLPPVGESKSPALSADYLRQNFGLQVLGMQLTEVVRQARDSGVLFNATEMRDRMIQNEYALPFMEEYRQDFERLSDAWEFEEALQENFIQGEEKGVILCRTNKRANAYNQQIRARIRSCEEQLDAGDLIMAVKNNYFWIPENDKPGYVANGDMFEVERVMEFEERYGSTFARVNARFLDYDNIPSFEYLVNLECLTVDGPALSKARMDELAERIIQEDMPDLKGSVWSYVMDHPYFQALQIKFAYAVTVHKSQGGQWDEIFVEHPWMPQAEIDLEYMRWLYTAVTRSKEKVHLLGFPDEYFKLDQ
jgi:exodeoxyribonuclease-5